MKKRDGDTVRAVEWADHAVRLLDQRVLPRQVVYTSYRTCRDVHDAIRDMVVRGAPAIGVTAAYAAVLAAGQAYAQQGAEWKRAYWSECDVLASARPTAVNLMWAVNAMKLAANALHDEGDPSAALLEVARRIHTDDITGNRRMGKYGAELIEPCEAVITHCNTGSLATGGYGTALGVIRSAFEQGRIKQVYADETRPWLQGARLTAWELVQDGIPVHLLADGAAAHLLKGGAVRWAVVGADRIAANGDVANKIGTYGLAVVARYHGVKFMVAAPTSTIDLRVPTGASIAIEQRQPEEVLECGGQRIAASGAGAWNPVFDVTPAELIDVIVTERGVIRNPSAAKIAEHMDLAAD